MDDPTCANWQLTRPPVRRGDQRRYVPRAALAATARLLLSAQLAREGLIGSSRSGWSRSWSSSLRIKTHCWPCLSGLGFTGAALHRRPDHAIARTVRGFLRSARSRRFAGAFTDAPVAGVWSGVAAVGDRGQRATFRLAREAIAVAEPLTYRAGCLHADSVSRVDSRGGARVPARGPGRVLARRARAVGATA
jgi:hypothetical protein